MIRNGNRKTLIFICVSVVIITLLHYFTLVPKTDLHDFYRRLYYIPIIVAAFKFRLRGGILTSIGVSLLYAPHMTVYFGVIDIEVLNQILEIIMFIVIGIVTGFSVESDYKKKKLLEIQVKQHTDLENYTQNILDSITNVFITLDRDLCVHSINKEGRDILNLTDSNIGEDLSSVFENYEDVEKVLNRVVVKEKKELGIETKCNSNNPNGLFVKLYAYPLKNILNKTEGVVVVLEDVSEIRKLESQIKRAEKLSAVGVLASGIAHEIRNPLGIIKTISQTIVHDIKDNDIKEGIEIIIHEVNRANNVIIGLLDFAKPSIGQVKAQSIGNIIKEILMITHNYAHQYNVKINSNIDEDIMVMLDEDKIKQAFVNILFNSIQAMPNGGNIYIEVSSNEYWANITFRDEGTGIPQDQLEKIYEPFYTTKDTGTGLGLPITHRIIEEHKGSMEISSVIGAGTTINMYLPLEN